MSSIKNLVFMLKTYRNDIEYVKRMLVGYKKYNRNDIPLYIVVPEKDLNVFRDELGEDCSFIAEETIPVKYCEEEINGISVGYINQEIVKLAFWKLGLCSNYVCLDSDVIFIRDFYETDFLYKDDIPYTVLIQDKDLKADPDYYQGYWKAREVYLERIKEELRFETDLLKTCHGCQTMSCKVLESLEREYMIPNQKSYVDLLKISPYEFSWYNFYLQKSNIIPIIHSEPQFKMIHTNYQFVFYKMMGIREEDWAKSYLGIIVNSNFSRRGGIKGYDQMFPTEYNVLRDSGQIRIAMRVLVHSIYKIFTCEIKQIVVKIIKT